MVTVADALAHITMPVSSLCMSMFILFQVVKESNILSPFTSGLRVGVHKCIQSVQCNRHQNELCKFRKIAIQQTNVNQLLLT